MKIKKIYYYSPEKLKLIPIPNVVPKVISILAVFAFLISLISTSVTYNLFSDSSVSALEKQNQIIEMEYEKEIDRLKRKYVNLTAKLNKIINFGNDLRISANLEPIDLKNRNYGIGGSETVDFSHISSLEENNKLSSIYSSVNEIEMNLQFETSNYEEIANKFSENKDFFNKLPAIKPVHSAIGDRFGMRFHPILKSRRMHNGLDFLANIGEEIVAPGDGIVTFIGNKGGYGKVLKINHGFNYETIYAHLSKFKVKKGQIVKRGDIIALTGNSGELSTGPHLHYEVRHKGVCLNPGNFMYEDLKLFDNSNDKLFASN